VGEGEGQNANYDRYRHRPSVRLNRVDRFRAQKECCHEGDATVGAEERVPSCSTASSPPIFFPSILQCASPGQVVGSALSHTVSSCGH